MRFAQALEASVMVRRVIGLATVARYDAARTSVSRAGGWHGVFTVIAARLLGQLPLAVLENAAILAVGVRAALIDARQC